MIEHDRRVCRSDEDSPRSLSCQRRRDHASPQRRKDDGLNASNGVGPEPPLGLRSMVFSGLRSAPDVYLLQCIRLYNVLLMVIWLHSTTRKPHDLNF